MEIISEGIVCASQSGTARESCAFPGGCVLPSGRWIASFRTASKKDNVLGQKVVLSFSDDQGKRWSEPFSPFDDVVEVEGKPGAFRGGFVASDGGNRVSISMYWIDESDYDRPFFNDDNGGLWDSRIFNAWSEDGGETWTKPLIVDTTPFNVPTAVTGRLLNLPSGELACHFETYNNFNDTCPWEFKSMMICSSDGGKSWPRHSVVHAANRIFCWDQRLNVLDDGSVFALFWTYDDVDSKYLNIHAAQSFDSGLTWSEPWDTGVPGQPGIANSTLDGGLVMSYVDRTDSPAIRMRTSHDGGKSWPNETEITLYDSKIVSQTTNKDSIQGVWDELEKYSVGLPAPSILVDGTILVIYYAGAETDRTDIRWSHVKI